MLKKILSSGLLATLSFRKDGFECFPGHLLRLCKTLNIVVLIAMLQQNKVLRSSLSSYKHLKIKLRVSLTGSSVSMVTLLAMRIDKNLFTKVQVIERTGVFLFR